MSVRSLNDLIFQALNGKKHLRPQFINYILCPPKSIQKFSVPLGIWEPISLKKLGRNMKKLTFAQVERGGRVTRILRLWNPTTSPPRLAIATQPLKARVV